MPDEISTVKAYVRRPTGVNLKEIVIEPLNKTCYVGKRAYRHVGIRKAYRWASHRDTSEHR